MSCVRCPGSVVLLVENCYARLIDGMMRNIGNVLDTICSYNAIILTLRSLKFYDY